MDKRGNHTSRASHVAERYNISRASLYRWAGDENNPFPKPHKIGPNTSVWFDAELDEYDELVRET